MRIPSLISFIGFIMTIAASYCPLVHFSIFVNWNAYDMCKPIGIIILMVAVVGIISTVFNLGKVTRLTAWLSLILVIILLIGTILKAHHEFSFIPIHFISNWLTRKIKYEWGWYLLFLGPLLALAGVIGKKGINSLKANS